MSELVNTRTRDVLYEDEFWVICSCGPRMWAAHRKSDGEHRLYWAFESLERDFGRIKSGKIASIERKEGK